jgi:hypothetical protein
LGLGVVPAAKPRKLLQFVQFAAAGKRTGNIGREPLYKNG